MPRRSGALSQRHRSDSLLQCALRATPTRAERANMPKCVLGSWPPRPDVRGLARDWARRAVIDQGSSHRDLAEAAITIRDLVVAVARTMLA